MTSWRDTASEQAQEDLDRLADSAVTAAMSMIDTRGEFYPFGAVIEDDGTARRVVADPEQGDHPESEAVLATLVQLLRRERQALRAAALVADVRTPSGDAVRVELEHREGHAFAVFLPYKKKRLGPGVDYAALNGGPGTRQIWD